MDVYDSFVRFQFRSITFKELFMKSKGERSSSEVSFLFVLEWVISIDMLIFLGSSQEITTVGRLYSLYSSVIFSKGSYNTRNRHFLANIGANPYTQFEFSAVIITTPINLRILKQILRGQLI